MCLRMLSGFGFIALRLINCRLCLTGAGRLHRLDQIACLYEDCKGVALIISDISHLP